MSEDNLSALHSAVNCYLSTLETVAHALAEACPPVGRPFGQRLSRLRARLAFDSGQEKLEESREITSREVLEYAEKASSYVDRQRVELRRAIAGMEEIVRTMAQRQEFYGERIRRFTMQIEKEHSPTPEPHVGALMSAVESMSNEAQSLVKKMRDQVAQVEASLAEAEIVDPVTGLINRREMQRSIEAHKARGESPVLLRFDLQGSLPDELARLVSARLVSQFRPTDLVARWSERQFLVLFQGREETARRRVEQIVPWVAGRYRLGGGSVVDVAVEAGVVGDTMPAEAELAIATT